MPRGFGFQRGATLRTTLTCGNPSSDEQVYSVVEDGVLGSTESQPAAPRPIGVFARAIFSVEEREMKKVVGVLLGTLLVALLVAAAVQPALADDQMKGQKSLYDRLGGKAAITAVVGQFVANVGADTRINKFFAHTDLEHLKAQLVNQICEASGGPCKYTGKSMKEVHKDMGVSAADFGALVEDLVKALDQLKVGEKEKGELLGVLGPMKTDIVTK